MNEPQTSLTVDLLRFESLLSELSADFIDLAPQHIDRAIQDSLERIVQALQIERCTLNRLYPLTGWIEVTHSFAVDGVEPVARSLPARSMFPWVSSRAFQNLATVFERLDDLPPEASVDKQNYRRIGLKSHVTMPIVVAGELHGSLSFGCIRAERKWPDGLLKRLRLLTQIFGSALARKQTQEVLDIAIGFERLASSILASLVLVKPGDEGSAILLGLQQIGEFVGAEHVSLWAYDGVAHFVPTRRWDARGFASPTSAEMSSMPPWINAQVAAGQVVRVPAVADLSAMAPRDCLALKAEGVRSLMVVPIAVAGRVAGALSLASLRREHQWPDALTPGVGLLAEVFASLHAREAAERRKFAAEVEAAHWRERLAHLVRVHTAGEMSVALAHEITQPLGAIENYALAARRRAGEAAPDLPRIVELLDKVIGQTTRAGDVVTRMRSMAQRHELEPKAIDLERAIGECVGTVKMDCELRDIRIELAPAPSLPMVVVDEIHLQQVVLNLLRNAMEAIELAPAGGARAITVAARLQSCDEVLIEVADCGTGIAEGDLERVFESFYSTKSGGLGVGLAICRKLIESHGGKLWASHREGGGALFSFTLPLAVR
ncbi:sensor histidine kinase [Variovorax sp. LARHSF232]